MPANCSCPLRLPTDLGTRSRVRPIVTRPLYGPLIRSTASASDAAGRSFHRTWGARVPQVRSCWAQGAVVKCPALQSRGWVNDKYVGLPKRIQKGRAKPPKATVWQSRKQKAEMEPPKATSMRPQSVLIAKGLRPESHPKATPKPPQSHPKATPKPPQSHLKATFEPDWTVIHTVSGGAVSFKLIRLLLQAGACRMNRVFLTASQLFLQNYN